MDYTKEQILQIKRLNEVTEITRKQYIDVLKESITKAENMALYIEMGDIAIDLIEELRTRCLFSLVSGEKYEVIKIVKDLIAYDGQFEDYPISDDKMQWIIRSFHDNFYDFDGFEEGVKKAMIETRDNYEKQ